MNILETAKSHPYLTGGMALAGVVAFFMLGGTGGGNDGGAPAVGDSVSGGTAFAQWQAQLTASQNAINADVSKTENANATALAAAKIAADNQFSIAQLQTGLGYAQISAQEHVSTLTVAAQEKQSKEETTRLQIQSNAATAQQALMTDVINRQTAVQSQVARGHPILDFAAKIIPFIGAFI